MPELPEVETIVRTLAPQVLEKYIAGSAVLAPKSLEAGAEHLPVLRGGRISAVRRRAKLLLLDIDLPEPLTLAFHLKMTGALFVHAPAQEPGRHTRLIFDLANDPEGSVTSLLFFDDIRRFGYCRILQSEDFRSWPFWNKLGPEPLTLAPDEFAARFAGKRSAIKALLLDQSVIAGVGNIYADESLFLAGIRPDAKAVEVPRARLLSLSAALKEVLEESIRQCGSSIRNYRDAEGKAGAFQNSFKVYGRHGQACRICGGILQKSSVAGRATVFCPNCQK